MPVEGGAVTDEYPAVAGIVTGDHIGCTGVLIGPRLIITAAHCAGPEVVVGVGGASDLRAATWSDVGLAWRHPRFDPATHRDDLGMLVLDRMPPVTPLALGAVPPPPGTELTVVGFGHASAAGDDPHLRRHGTVTLAAIEADTLVLAAASSSPCYGDSGGAVLWTTSAGQRLVGVLTAGDASCSTTARAIRVDAYTADVIAPLAAAADPGGVADGGWCLDDQSCAVGTCWFPPDAPTRGYCARACAGGGDDDCGSGATCTGGLCLLPAPSPGAFGAACSVDLSCDRGRCAATAEDATPRCTVRCFDDSADVCPADTTCVASATPAVEVCGARTGGCHAGADGGVTTVGLVALALALAMMARRHDRSPRGL